MSNKGSAARRMLAGFPILLILLAGTFVWLAWGQIAQDRVREKRRSQELLEIVADRLLASLQRSLSELTSRTDLLAAGLPPSNEIPDNTVLLAADGPVLQVYPDQRIIFYPGTPGAPEPDASVFAQGEDLEFRKQDLAAAVQSYRRAARSSEPAVAAGALVGVIRTARKAGRSDDAMAACEELERLGKAPVTSLPAGFLARILRCRILGEAERQREQEQEALATLREMLGGRWRLSRTDFELFLKEVQGMTAGSAAPAPSPDDVALAAAVDWLWSHRGDETPEGRRFVTVERQPVLVSWSESGGRWAAHVAGPRYLRGLVQNLPLEKNIQVALADPEGRLLLGGVDEHAREKAVRAAAVNHMPWSLHLASTAALDPGYAQRRFLLVSGTVLITLVLLAGAYWSWRSICRELAVARLQSDFVSAVSHEFRSPLSALLQISELLARDRVPTEDHRRRFYDALVRESRRLHRLVENLLDFGRMEAGAARFAFETVELSEVARSVAVEFQQQSGSNGHRIELSVVPEPLPVRADPEALSRALWNLLDNAAKYSPESDRIVVETARVGDAHAVVKVQDFGLGIAPADRQAIFLKFVRGGNTSASAIKGTGLGLSMVQHIVRAHKGEIRLESEVGRGSTFELRLPIDVDCRSGGGHENSQS